MTEPAFEVINLGWLARGLSPALAGPTSCRSYAGRRSARRPPARRDPDPRASGPTARQAAQSASWSRSGWPPPSSPRPQRNPHRPDALAGPRAYHRWPKSPPHGPPATSIQHDAPINSLRRPLLARADHPDRDGRRHDPNPGTGGQRRVRRPRRGRYRCRACCGCRCSEPEAAGVADAQGHDGFHQSRAIGSSRGYSACFSATTASGKGSAK
jgi:hypothetical protein